MVSCWYERWDSNRAWVLRGCCPMKSRWMKWGGAVASIVLLGAGGFLGAARWCPLPEGLNPPHAQIVVDRHGGWLRAYSSDDGRRTWRVPITRDALPDSLVHAVISFEDRRFRRHFGIDPIAAGRALFDNARAGRVVSGASTLTMQVARMLRRRPRTLRAKVVEAFVAVQLEMHMSKDEILTAYLNLAPYGGNIEGVGAASWFYYGKPVSQLRPDESAALAAIPNAPNRLRPDRDKDALRIRRNDVLTRMASDGLISADEAEAARALPILAERRAVPFGAPHLAGLLHRREPRATTIQTTIDPEIQRSAERLLEHHIRGLESKGIANGAVVIIENETRAVRAWVGSKAFFDLASQGQVDGALALRSPGSTLKPFVYAMALDRGLIGLSTLLDDVPIHYQDWSPVNFDGKWRGVVSARDALASSLNVPAVKLAERLEPDGLVQFLHRAQLSGFRDNLERYGLATVLGGCEVSLLELTNLYATLAQGGQHRPPILTAGDSEVVERAASTTLLSEDAAYLISEILTDVRRPELPDNWKDAVAMPRLAWKTGTSYGRRDAWSVGYNRQFTVGVWVGNFDGRGVPELVGVQAAAPLLFAIAQVLPGAASDGWIPRPVGVSSREVCALSGALPTAGCPHRVMELALRDRAPLARCGHHVAMDIDDDTGLRLCSKCRRFHPHHQEVHVVWPAGVATFLGRSGLAVDPVPKHNPLCSSVLVGDAPMIQWPRDGDHFVLRPGVPLSHQQIALLASSEGGVGRMFWFMDDGLISEGPAGERVMLDPVLGMHRLTVVDDQGRSASIRIAIED